MFKKEQKERLVKNLEYRDKIEAVLSYSLDDARHFAYMESDKQLEQTMRVIKKCLEALDN